MCLSPSSSGKHTKVVAVHCHSHILIWIVEQCCTVFASSEASQLSTDQVHIIKLPDANFVFAILLTILCEKSGVKESLGRSLEMCSADVVLSHFPLFDKLTDIMIETSTASRGGIARTTEKRVERGFSPRCMSSWMFMQPITISIVLSHVALHHHMKTFTT